MCKIFFVPYKIKKKIDTFYGENPSVSLHVNIPNSCKGLLGTELQF
jgi:hypothetical protein